MKAKTKLNKIQLREERAGYGFLLLSLIGTTIFIIVPILMSMFLGFTTWNPMKGLAGLDFVGLQNFRDMAGTSGSGPLSGITWCIPCPTFL